METTDNLKETRSRSPRLTKSLREWLALPANAGSLAVFRICFGFIMLLEAISICRPMASAAGSIPLETYYTSPEITFHLPYPGFEWLPLFSPVGMRAVVWILGLAGIGVMVGFAYRISALLVFLTWGYLYVVESTRTYWMSYYYLELLFSFLLIWMPAARVYSIDAALRKSGDKDRTVPFWTIFLLRSQLAIAYFFAGIAKLNSDWLLDAQPVRRYLADASVGLHSQLLQSLFGSVSFAYVLSWMGALFDLGISLLLLVPRTRVFGLVLILIFHSTNHFLLFKDLVWFPLLGVLTATIFLAPDWPQRFAKWILKPRLRPPDWKWFFAGAALIPVVGAALGWRSDRLKPNVSGGRPVGAFCASLVLGWIFIQLLLPVRHLMIPGDARVTFEGLSFSWRLKAEVYSTEPAKIFLNDPAIISRTAGGQMQIDWTRWHGDKILYRVLKPRDIPWASLPEIVVLFEPRLGERVVYNPLSGGKERSEAESRARVQTLWHERYGREPKGLHRTVPLESILTGYVRSLRARGYSVPDPASAEGTRLLLDGMQADASLRSVLRRMHPFAFESISTNSAQFFLVDDPLLIKSGPNDITQVDRAAWKAEEESMVSDMAAIHHVGARPLVLHLLDDPLALGAILPRASMILPSSDHSHPRIAWNYFKDATLSKSMHISTNPFLLRRYAQRIARLWKDETGTDAEVYAETGLSLNGRPPQPTVDPRVDIAAAPVKFFGHNGWVNDLQQHRIPKATVPNQVTGHAAY